MNITFMFDNHTFRRINALTREMRKKEILDLFAQDGYGSVFARSVIEHKIVCWIGGIEIEEIEEFLNEVDEFENWEAR